MLNLKQHAYDAGVILFAFPSKTTHKLQPLDVGVFGCVQTAWSTHCDRKLSEGVKIDCYNVIHEYSAIRHVITSDLIQKAFKSTGIFPLNPIIFTDQDFAPSWPRHLPNMFYPPSLTKYQHPQSPSAQIWKTATLFCLKMTLTTLSKAIQKKPLR